MSTSDRELTHPSWRRAPDEELSPRESLMSQMVRAQLIFDRRTPSSGMPAWRDSDGGATPVRVDTRVGSGAAEFMAELTGYDGGGERVIGLAENPTPFAQELAERLQMARDRVEAEHDHLAQVGTVAAAYLGRPKLRLIK